MLIVIRARRDAIPRGVAFRADRGLPGSTTLGMIPSLLKQILAPDRRKVGQQTEKLTRRIPNWAKVEIFTPYVNAET
jgi:hypothetical protein